MHPAHYGFLIIAIQIYTLTHSKEELKIKKMNGPMLRSVGKQSGESTESVLKKKKEEEEATVERICGKRGF